MVFLRGILLSKRQFYLFFPSYFFVVNLHSRHSAGKFCIPLSLPVVHVENITIQHHAKYT